MAKPKTNEKLENRAKEPDRKKAVHAFGNAFFG